MPSQSAQKPKSFVYYLNIKSKTDQMVDYQALVKHHSLQKDVQTIVQLNEERKSLIKMAIFKLLSFQKVQNSESLDEQVASLKSQVNEYELYINKLKQENSSKMIILNGKIKAQQQELVKVNKQLKDSKENKGAFRTKLAKPVFNSGNYLSPTFGSKSKSIYSDDEESILTPVIRKETSKISLKRLDEGPEVRQTRSKKIEDTPSLPPAKPTSPYKTPSKSTFIENFDKTDDSDHSDSDPQSFTPTRKAANTTSNSPIAKVVQPKIKRKKLKLRKSIKTDVQTSPRSARKLGIDNDDMDTATYYSDANFLNEETPHKRPKFGR